ncbi:unnamed protein product [Rhizoctonia solani]|uniref:Glutamine synthetase n=1 Tax=Rhizoctonia solani TaxID=456999 RepID=A0A8H3AKY6_9AGAM|nr:unnamed protein product [Rhizoctonia solani]
MVSSLLSQNNRYENALTAIVSRLNTSGNDGLCFKTMTVTNEVKSIDDLCIWHFDGSSTNQAPGHDSNILVLVETYNDGTPNRNNYCHHAKKIMDLAKDEHPRFGLKQEYTLFDANSAPYGWPKGGFPGPQGPCYVGTGKVFARNLIEVEYRAWLYAGTRISGIDAGVPGRRLSESSRSLSTPSLLSDRNGAGCHSNYSTLPRCEEGGIKAIEAAIEKLGKRHNGHIAAYGEDGDLQ